MESEHLKQKILEANAAYRVGKPIISDQEFDDLCDELKTKLSGEEWTVFRSTLFETAGKVKHPYAMGSLEKIKYEEPQNVCKWINEHVENALNVSAKIDGISCRLHYEDGKLVSATTRGNGSAGENITDKIFYVSGIPTKILEKETLDVRGELVIFKDVFYEKYSDRFANPRNTTAGFIGKKEVVPNELKDISFVAYTIFGDKYSKQQQFYILKKNGFNVAWHKSISIAELQAKSAVTFDRVNEELKSYVKQDLPYETDGIVLSDNEYHNENVLIPENQCAFKVNDTVAESVVIDVNWGEPSKNGRMSPVLVIEPVQILGTIVSNITANNLDFMQKMDVRYGSRIRFTKSGEIIPKLLEVVENPPESREIVPPYECPECGAKLIVDGVDLRCPNEECPSRKYAAITAFIRNFDVKHSAKKQLMNFGIDSIETLMKFQPDLSRKSEVTLYKEICDKIFTASKEKIFCSMPFFKNLGETQLMKIVEHYGFDYIMSLGGDRQNDRRVIAEYNELVYNTPSGIGEALIDNFCDGLENAQKNTRLILDDSRYVGTMQNVKNATTTSSTSLGSICFTGTLETMGRKEAQKLAESVGFEVKGGVTKGLTYLVIADPNSQSSKARKARELGTKLLSEKEFLDMCKGEEQDLDNL